MDEHALVVESYEIWKKNMKQITMLKKEKKYDSIKKVLSKRLKEQRNDYEDGWTCTCTWKL